MEVALETLSATGSGPKILLVDAIGMGPPFAERVLAIHQRFTELIQRYLDQAVAEGDLEPQDTALAATVWSAPSTSSWSVGCSMKRPGLRSLQRRSRR